MNIVLFQVIVCWLDHDVFFVDKTLAWCTMRDSYMQVWNRIQFQLQCNWIFFKFEIHFFFLLENQLCKIDNGGCSYLCLLTPNGSVCACPDGSPLSKDGKRCLAGKNFLIGYCHRFTSRWFWFECPNKNFTKPKLKPGLNNSSEDTVLIRGGQIYQCRSLKSECRPLRVEIVFLVTISWFSDCCLRNKSIL